MGNPRPGEKSGEGIENPQSGTCISLLSDFLRKTSLHVTTTLRRYIINLLQPSRLVLYNRDK